MTLILAGMMALTVSVPHLIGVIVLYTVLVFVESHVLSPLLFGRAVGLPPVAILLALLAGVELIGVAGALVAVPVLVILWVIFRALVPAANTPAATGAPPVATTPGPADSVALNPAEPPAR